MKLASSAKIRINAKKRPPDVPTIESSPKSEVLLRTDTHTHTRPSVMLPCLPDTVMFISMLFNAALLRLTAFLP